MKQSTIDIWRERITCEKRLLFELAQPEENDPFQTGRCRKEINQETVIVTE